MEKKKWFPLARKISCPLARISFFLENGFPLIPIMISANRKTEQKQVKNIFSTRQKMRFQ